MPAIAPPALVLVTGASGFIGTHTVAALLSAGFKVRAAVRNAVKGEYVAKAFLGASYVLVPDITTPGAFDEAIKDVEGVCHIASPLDLDNKGDPQNVIGPAVGGVTRLLEGISRANLNSQADVKRIVQISSIGSIGRKGPVVRYTEDDWNDWAITEAKTKGASADGYAKYQASKTLAERAFWNGLKTLPGLKGVGGVAICPAMMQGAPTQYLASGSLSDITGTVSWTLPFLDQGEKDLALQYFNWVNVDDVARAMVIGLQDERAKGRYTLSGGTTFANDFAEAAAEVFPEKNLLKPKSKEEREKMDEQATVWDGSKIVRELGFTYTDKKTTFVDTYKAIKAMV